MKPAYFNEIDPYAAEWLRNLIAAGHLPAGDVDTRSIVDVAADDLVGYGQCHFFAGIGGWALAARLAGWPDDRELWTGSCPCQPFSVAGKGAGTDDERHLWPHQFRLIRARRPAVWMGEQVAAAVGKDWLDGVLADLEGIGYAGRAAVVPACAADAPHRRDRLWVVTERGGAVDHSKRPRLEGLAGDGNDPLGRPQPDRPASEAGGGGDVADSISGGDRRKEPAADHVRPQADGPSNWVGRRCDARGSAWGGAGWIIGHDGKARRVGTRIRRVVDGLSAGLDRVRPDGGAEEVEMIPLLERGAVARVGKLRAFGNAIVPQVAAEVIAAYLDCMPEVA